MGLWTFKLREILNMELEPNSVSSDPFQVCLCIGGTPCCNTLEESRKVYPGELLRIPVVAVGQNNGVVPAVIRAYTHGNTFISSTSIHSRSEEKLHWTILPSALFNCQQQWYFITLQKCLVKTAQAVVNVVSVRSICKDIHNTLMGTPTTQSLRVKTGSFSNNYRGWNKFQTVFSLLHKTTSNTATFRSLLYRFV